MNRENVAGSWQRVGSIVTIVIIVAALRLAKDLLVPFALGALLAFLLAPIVHGLERLRFPRIPAVVLTMLLAAAGIGALGWLVWGQLGDLADTLPKYRQNILAKIESFRGVGSGPLQKIQEATAPEPEPDAPPAAPGRAPGPADRIAGRPEKPIPVQVVQPSPSVFQGLSDALGPLAGPLGTAGVVFVLAVFMLLYHEDLRDRMIRLVSRGQIVVTTQALAEASQKTSRYLLTTLTINALYGIPIGVGLYALGVPNALLWGLLATVLRFIPYLGPWIAAAFPIALSFAVFPGWTDTIKVVVLFVVIELISNNVIEPWLYGKRTGLSPMAVIVAAVFWSWLWGVVGLLLAIPLTLLLAVVGRHVPQLYFLNVLLGDEPSLGPEERFYQRLVAGDADEALKVAETFLETHPPEALYDAVVLPALRAAKADVAEGRLEGEALESLRQDAEAVLDDLAEAKRRETPKAAAAAAAVVAAAATSRAADPAADGMERVEAAAAPAPGAASPSLFRGVRVLFLPASDAMDALAGRMVALSLRADGIETRVLSGMALSGEAVDAAVKDGADIVVVGGFPPAAVLRARHLCKRLRADASGVRIVVAVWDPSPEARRVEDRLSTACADRVATTIAKAVEAVRGLAAELVAARPSAAKPTPQRAS